MHVRGLLRGAPLQAPAAYARKALPTGTYSNARPQRASPACEPCHRSWNRTLVPSSVRISDRVANCLVRIEGRRGPRPLRGIVNGPGACRSAKVVQQVHAVRTQVAATGHQRALAYLDEHLLAGMLIES
jgi:hypothetical protein